MRRESFILFDFLIIAALRQEVELLRRKIVGAMSKEIGPMRAICGSFHGRSIALVVSGVGPLKAARATRNAIEAFKPKALLSVGFAGGLREGIAPGDIVIAEGLIFSPSLDRLIPQKAVMGARQYAPSKQLYSQARAACAAISIPCHSGRAITVRKPICTPERKKQAGAAYAAISVDMESAPIAHIAMKSGKEFLSIRAISDAIGDELPDLGGAFGPGLLPRKLRRAARLAGRPRSWTPTLKFGLNCALARKNLFLFLDNFFRIAAAPQ